MSDFITDETVVGYRITLKIDEYKRETDAYCRFHAREMDADRFPINAHTARKYHIFCCVCHSFYEQDNLVEKYLIDLLDLYKSAIKDAEHLLTINPLGYVHGASSYGYFKKEEKTWRGRIGRLLEHPHFPGEGNE